LFLEAHADKASGEGNVEPYLLLRSVIALLQLKLRQLSVDEYKKLLDDIRKRLEGITGIDNSIYSYFYRAEAEYYKVCLRHSNAFVILINQTVA
jgi:hypothetical protein